MRRLPVLSLVLLMACGDRSGKTLDDPVFPLPEPPVTTAAPFDATLPTEPVEISAPFTLTAPWVDGAVLPDRQTCRGAALPPALTWSGVPVDAVELALTVVDLADGGSTNWIVAGISAIDTGIAEGELPATAFELTNDSGSSAWVAPCPPAGETHRYEFTLHALNQQLEVADNARATDVLALLDAITIARTSVSGVASTN